MYADTLAVSSKAWYVSCMEQKERERGNPPGPTCEHVAANLKRIREAQGLGLRPLADKVKALGREISPSGISKIETGIRRVDVDDLAVLAYALGTTPVELLTPPEPEALPTGIPAGRFHPEEVEAWLHGHVALTPERLVLFWTERAMHTRYQVQVQQGLLEDYAKQGQGLSTVEDYERRIGELNDYLAFIRARQYELDPTGESIPGERVRVMFEQEKAAQAAADKPLHPDEA